MEKEKPLVLLLPHLHDLLKKELEAFHLHVYDLRARVVENKNDFTVILSFGESFQHSRSKSFSTKKRDECEKEWVDFFRETSERCRETLIADYYKMIKP